MFMELSGGIMQVKKIKELFGVLMNTNGKERKIGT